MSVQMTVDVNAATFLPDERALTENAVVEIEESDGFDVSIESVGPDSMIRVRAQKYGKTSFVIKDGDAEYRYLLDVYEDDKGHSQISIIPEG